MRSSFPVLLSLFLLLMQIQLSAQQNIIPGAERTEAYIPLVTDKKIALVVNQTSLVNGVLLPDTLIKRGIKVQKIFSPEHGFRGEADAGAAVKTGVDIKTGLPVVSLYGNNKKPTVDQLKDVDIVIYDLQDVGVRFYTYISTLEYIMDACAENEKKLIILDRPNPLGFIVDGPVLDRRHKSFVGMQPIPVIYGMTPGEYAKMLIGEKWIKNTSLDLEVVTCENYDHKSFYHLPVAPSPNLKTMAAVYLYPSLCFFEGTAISVGRGTNFPFQQYGHPKLKNQPHGFTPESRIGATSPPYKDQYCYGQKIADTYEEALTAIDGHLNLKWLMGAYRNFPDKEKFFNSFFEKLAGNDLLRQQIIAGMTEKEIRKSWEPQLENFKSIRKRYLLYNDQ